MDLASCYVLDGNTFKEIEREMGYSFCGTAHFYFHLFRKVDIRSRIANKISFINEPYTLIFFILQKCKVNVMLTNSSSPLKSAK